MSCVRRTWSRCSLGGVVVVIGAAPFALTMLIVLILIIIFPDISLALVDLRRFLMAP